MHFLCMQWGVQGAWWDTQGAVQGRKLGNDHPGHIQMPFTIPHPSVCEGRGSPARLHASSVSGASG